MKNEDKECYCGFLKEYKGRRCWDCPLFEEELTPPPPKKVQKTI